MTSLKSAHLPFSLFLLLLLIVTPGCGSTYNATSRVTKNQPATAQSGENTVVFAQDGSLVRIDQSGQSPVQITTGYRDGAPAFHPLGVNIVFTRQPLEGGIQELYTVRPDGTGVTPLTADFGHSAFAPSYSWDGTEIVFSAALSGTDRDLFIMKADGSDLRPLTQGPSDDHHPAFSSDGRTVVFERDSGSLSKISQVSLDNGSVLDLTDGLHDDRTPSFCPPLDDVLFSRDGNIVLMHRSQLPGEPGSLVDNLDQVSSFFPRHSLENDSIFFLTASPQNRLDGSLLAQSAGEAGEVWVMNSDESDPRQLTQNARAEGLAVGPSTGSPPPNQVDVEIVNDSDVADSDVYILLDTPKSSGQIVEGGNLKLLSNAGAPTANGQGIPLSTLTNTGRTLLSPYTKKTRPIYTFRVKNLESGQVNISYKQPVVIANGASPTADESYRYDKMELTYLAERNGSPGGGGNLTSIDFFGIPLQVEVIHWQEALPDPLQSKTFYASTSTILKTFASLNASMSTGAGWSRSLSGGTFDPQATDFTDFARILSPNTIAAADLPQARPDPYPSFSNYLASLNGQEFLVNGSQQGGYRYTCRVVQSGSDFSIVCRGTLNTPAPSPLPNNADVTLNLPAGQPGPSTDPAISMDFFTYACVPNRYSYSIAGFPFSGANDAEIQSKVDLANSSAYGALVGDIQAALNFGYPNSKWAPPNADIDRLYGAVVLPYPYPFAGARHSNDGFYNPYAAVFYYLSDSYGHPFSDRLDAASPLYELTAGDTARITILNDNRLDAPRVTVANASDTTLALSWPSVEGATSYRVTLSPSPASDPVIVAATSGVVSTTLTGLDPGTPYLIGVTAIGSAQIQSATLEVQGVTTGTRVISADGPIKFQANLNLPDNLPDRDSFQVFIDEQQISPTANASVSGVPGVNVLGLEIKGPSGTVYRGNYSLNLIEAGANQFGLGTPFELEYNLTPLSAAPETQKIFDFQSNLVVGTPFTPKPYYQFFPTVFP